MSMRVAARTLGLAAACAAAAAVLPTVALGAAVTRGSALNEPPNLHGCDIKPALVPPAGVNGDFTPVPSGTADCTWRQSGVFGSLNDPRVSSVPGDGRITRISVRSGPNPSPLRFVIMRQLAAPGAGDNCCFFVSETAPVQPAPNTISTFPVNIPVERNFKEAVMGTDMVGISGQAGAGTLPLRVVGNTNSFAQTQVGNPSAGFWYPRMGAIPNDSGGGRREEGIPGVEVLINWTWCATGDASCQPTVPQTPTRQAGIADLGAQLARIQAGSALIRLICNGNLACEGRLELVNQSAAAKAAKKKTVYGKARFKITAGKRKTVRVRLTKRGKTLVKARKKAKVGIRLIPKSGPASNGRVTLKR